MSDPSTPKPFAEKRAAPRTATPVDILLRCPDKSGKTFVEKTQTVDISRTGAKTLTEHDVKPGARLQMAIPHLKRSSWATVERVANTTGNMKELGVVIEETNDFWGVQLPDEMQTTRNEETAPEQVSMEPEANSVPPEINPSLTLVEQLLASTGNKQENTPATLEADHETADRLLQVLREQASSAIEQSIENARQQLNEQAEEIMKNLQQVIARQLEKSMRKCVKVALHQK